MTTYYVILTAKNDDPASDLMGTMPLKFEALHVSTSDVLCVAEFTQILQALPSGRTYLAVRVGLGDNVDIIMWHGPILLNSRFERTDLLRLLVNLYEVCEVAIEKEGLPIP